MVKVNFWVSVSSAPLLMTANTTRSSMVPAVAALNTPASVMAPVASPGSNVVSKVKTLVSAVWA